MSVFESILYVLQAEMERPGNYSVFHICCLILTAAVTAFLVWRFRNSSDKTVRRLLFVVWVVLVVFEIYKQLVFSLNVSDGVASWSYQWYAFPFQFCSTPLYALPFIVFLKDGWVRNSFIVFFSGFSLFAGMAVMFYPNDVFINMIGINIQTMVHHGAQVAVGIFLVAHNRRRTKLSHLGGSLIIFYVFCAIAMILNESINAFLVANGLSDAFNMFYISQYHDCTLPVLSEVYKAVSYPVFLVIYIIGFSGISALFYGVERWIVKLTAKKEARVSETVNI